MPFFNIPTQEPDPHNFDADGNGQGCEGQGGTGNVDDTTPAARQSVTFSGGGYAPNRTVNVFFLSHYRLLTSVASDAAGRISTVVTIPEGASGNHTLVANGPHATESVGRLVLRREINVGGTAADGDGLPVNGANSVAMGLSGLTLIEAGWALMLLQQRLRRRRTA